MRHPIQILVIVLMILLSIAARHLSALSPKAYFVGEAMNWVLVSFLLVSLIKNPYVCLTAKLFRNLTILNLIDEISQYPTRYEPWEYLAAIILIWHWVRSWVKLRRQHKKAEDDSRPPNKHFLNFRK